MSYDLDRDPAKEPSLADMTTKVMDVLGKNSKGYFLMVEGGRIDHALHETTAKIALQDTVTFDGAENPRVEPLIRPRGISPSTQLQSPGRRSSR